jgi:hypothetical protein
MEQAIYDWIAEHALGWLDRETARGYLQQGEILLILDGVDEVPCSHGEGAETWHPRGLLLSGLAAALAGRGQSGGPGCKTRR